MRKHGRNCRDYLANILCIWSAGRERSYEGIGFISVALVWGIKAKADVRRYNKKMTYARCMPFFIIFCALLIA